MNQKPKAALDTLKKSAELGEKAINTLEEYVNELEIRTRANIPIRQKSESLLDNEEREILEQMEEFVPKTIEDEYRNKLFVRLINNFTFAQLEYIEELGKTFFDKTHKYH